MLAYRTREHIDHCYSVRMLRSFLAAFIFVALLPVSVLAQDRIVTSSEVSHSYSINGFSREYWVAILNNLSPGSSYTLHVRARKPTVLKIGLGNEAPYTLPIQADTVYEQVIPLTWQMLHSVTKFSGLLLPPSACCSMWCTSRCRGSAGFQIFWDQRHRVHV